MDVRWWVSGSRRGLKCSGWNDVLCAAFVAVVAPDRVQVNRALTFPVKNRIMPGSGRAGGMIPMSGSDYRCVMSAADFDAIPVDEDYPIHGYYDALIEENGQLGYEIIEDNEELRKLTNGQRMLIQLGTFDSQVSNGGVTQFFWSCPEWIFDVADWIKYLGLSELHANYERALETLLGNKDRWLALREECYKIRDNPRKESSRQTYRLLSLSWFDNAYFDRYDYNAKGEWGRQARGLKHVLL